MEVVYEFVLVTYECVLRFITDDTTIFYDPFELNKATLLSAFILLSVLLGLFTQKSSLLWNKKALDKSNFRVLSFFSFFITLIFLISFHSLDYLKEVSAARINHWETNIQNNQKWKVDTFSKAYYAVKNKGEEDFYGSLVPEQGGRSVPANKESSRHIIANTYVIRAIERFNISHPYLSLILKADLEMSEREVYQDIGVLVRNNPEAGGEYDLAGAVRISADKLRIGLELHIPQLIKTSGHFLFFTYIAIISIIFILVGVFSCREIKIFR